MYEDKFSRKYVILEIMWENDKLNPLSFQRFF